MKSKLNFGWKDVGELWWLFVALLLLCGMTLYVVHCLPHKAPVMDQEDLDRAPVADYETVPIITVTCSKEIEDKNCAGMVSPECEPECHGACTKKKAETAETATDKKVIYDYKGEDDGWKE